MPVASARSSSRVSSEHDVGLPAVATLPVGSCIRPSLGRFFEDVTARGQRGRPGPQPFGGGWVDVKADGSEGQSCGGVVRMRRRYSNAYCPSGPHPSDASRRAISSGPGVESIAEWKLCRQQLSEDRKVEVSGRDLR
jgi:hypothetical protein